jgi:hypothetical protein
MTINEYDVVEITSDHPELSPVLVRGARGIVVDLPPGSTVAAVEFDLADRIDVFLLDVEALHPIEPTTELAHDREHD